MKTKCLLPLIVLLMLFVNVGNAFSEDPPSEDDIKQYAEAGNKEAFEEAVRQYIQGEEYWHSNFDYFSRKAIDFEGKELLSFLCTEYLTYYNWYRKIELLVERATAFDNKELWIEIIDAALEVYNNRINDEIYELTKSLCS